MCAANLEPGRRALSTNELINVMKELYAQECRLREKSKTVLATSFGFQQIICQQLVVKQSGVGPGVDKMHKRKIDRKSVV